MAKPKEPQYEINGFATFVGYDPKALADGQVPILTAGSRVQITKAGEDEGSFEVVQLDDAGEVMLGEDDQPIGDTVFVEEISPIEEAETATAAPAPAPAAKKTPAKPAPKTPPTKPAPKPAPAAAKPAAKPAPAKPAPKAAPAPAAKKTPAKPAPAAAKPAAKPAAAPAAAPARTRQRPAAAKKTPAVKEPKAPEPPAAIVDTARLTEVMTEQGDALTAAKALVTAIDENYFTLGGVLSHIKASNAFLTIVDGKKHAIYQGERAFDAYTQAELGVAGRKADYLINIYSTFSALGVDEAQLTLIGWTKAKDLARVATSENYEKLLAYAQNHSSADVEAHVRKLKEKQEASGTAKKGKGRATTATVKVPFRFRMPEDSAAVFTQALDLAKEKTEKEDPNANLNLIVTEWLTLQEGIEVDAQVALDAYNARFGTDFAFAEEAAA